MSVLVNAQEQHIRNPDTFEIPTYNELNNIKLGDFVNVKILDCTTATLIGEPVGYSDNN